MLEKPGERDLKGKKDNSTIWQVIKFYDIIKEHRLSKVERSVAII